MTGRPHSAWTIALSVCAVVMALAALAKVAEAYGRPWAPLGPYSEVHVVSSLGDPRVKGVEVPGPVRTAGQRCASETVMVVGVVSWVSVDPAGSIVPVGQEASSRLAGCHDHHWAMPIPPGVSQRTVEEGGRMAWRVSGTDTPYGDSGRAGVPALWSSEPFTVVVPISGRG